MYTGHSIMRVSIGSLWIPWEKCRITKIKTRSSVCTQFKKRVFFCLDKGVFFLIEAILCPMLKAHLLGKSFYCWDLVSQKSPIIFFSGSFSFIPTLLSLPLPRTLVQFPLPQLPNSCPSSFLLTARWDCVIFPTTTIVTLLATISDVLQASTYKAPLQLPLKIASLLMTFGSLSSVDSFCAMW